MEEIELVGTVKDLLKVRAGIGCRKSRWNPKMRIFIYREQNGIYIFDLVKTAVCLFCACKYLKQESKRQKTFLFVGTKATAAPIVVREARKCGASYVVTRWRSGTLTNWEVCRSRIEYFNVLNLLKKGGKMRFLGTKKEVARFERVRKSMKRGLGGLRNLIQIPDCVIVVDPKYERRVIGECVKLKIPVVSIIDADGDPTLVDIPIPANAEAPITLEFLLGCLSNAILSGRLG